MRRHLISILYAGLFLIGLHPAIHAQTIVATESSDGRMVYENAPEKTVQTIKEDVEWAKHRTT